VFVAASVPDAAVEHVVHLAFHAEITLETHQKPAGFPQIRLVFGSLRGQQCHHGDGSVVSNEIAPVNPAVRLGATQHITIAAGQHRRFWSAFRGLALQGCQGQSGDGGLIRRGPPAIGVLIVG
jgi:hypothetical protein